MNSSIKYGLLLIIMISLIVYIFRLNIKDAIHITGLNRMSEGFNTDINGTCDNLMTTKLLYTPTAVSIPSHGEQPIFNTLKNVKEPSDKMKFKGKYCFPIEKLMYDGVWDSSVIDMDTTNPEKQQRNWISPNYKPTNGLYCGDQLLQLPEKMLKMGDEIITSDNTEKYYPTPGEVAEKVRGCTQIHTCDEPTDFQKDGLIRTTDGVWKLNAV
jgi:hypothetical protein